MPNWVRTAVKFKNIKTEDDFEFITRMISTPLTPDDDLFISYEDRYKVDFNKIIPEPRTIEECPKYAIISERSRVEVDDDRPWFDWYNWRIKNWGTKWEANLRVLNKE